MGLVYLNVVKLHEGKAQIDTVFDPKGLTPNTHNL